MARTRSKSKGRSDAPSGFAGIPRIVMDHPDFINLSYSAKTLLLLLAYQFKGSNNGDLTAAYSYMKPRGIKGTDTLQKAIQELLQANIIIRTREGKFTNPGGRCALYALTWKSIDECVKKHLEVAPTTSPPRKFSLEKLSNAPHQKLA